MHFTCVYVCVNVSRVLCASVDGSVCEWMDVCLRVYVCALMCVSSVHVDGFVCEWMDVCACVCVYVCLRVCVRALMCASSVDGSCVCING